MFSYEKNKFAFCLALNKEEATAAFFICFFFFFSQLWQLMTWVGVVTKWSKCRWRHIEMVPKHKVQFSWHASFKLFRFWKEHFSKATCRHMSTAKRRKRDIHLLKHENFSKTFNSFFFLRTIVKERILPFGELHFQQRNKLLMIQNNQN